MNNFTRALTVAAIFLCMPLYAVHADTFDALVVGITDGDTIKVLKDDNEQLKVRLVEIDAPEKKQAFGNRSKQSLSDYCFKKTATLTEKGKDRFGRTLARVTCNGVDVNAEMVKVGMAWVYDKYVTDRSLYVLQDEAKAARRGLWADLHPVPPWEWRHLKDGTR
jgi:endonuclease YncB( thermonuclease family)